MALCSKASIYKYLGGTKAGLRPDTMRHLNLKLTDEEDNILLTG